MGTNVALLDGVVLRPHAITLLVFVPRGGRLSIPALSYGSWLLDGIPLPADAGFGNPFEQFVQQKTALEEWLRPRLSPEQANLRFITGVVIFGAPITFAPDVEAALNSAAANGFQLLTNPAELPRRLRQLATPEIDLSDEDLAEWSATMLAGNDNQPLAFSNEHAEPQASAFEAGNEPAPQPTQADGPANFLSQKARQLWGWLGAADILDDDLPYGYANAAVAARSEEKEHLEQLRQQLQADVAAQLRAMEARENERERSIAQLRSELAQAPAVAPEAAALAARLAAENREKAALETAMQTSRAESAARNQELDAKIQQLTHLIERLNSAPAPPAAESARPPAAGPAPVPSRAALKSVATHLGTVLPKLVPAVAARVRQLRGWRQWVPRLGVVAGAVALVGVGAWGLSHLNGSPPVPYQENGRWGFADANGQPVIPAQFTAASPFQAGRAVVAKNKAYGIIAADGKEIVPPAYDALSPYAGGYAKARVGEAYTFVDEKGEEFGNYYFNALDFAEGHAAVLDYRGWHYITGPTEPEQPVIFLEAHSFADGLARVRLADGYTYITPDYLDDPSEGTKPFGRYEHATDFAQGRARVSQNGRSFLIDKQGEELK